MAKKEIEKKNDSTPKKERKKPGPKKGSPSNNPNGRTKGAKNKVPNRVKVLMEDFVADEFEQFKLDYAAIEEKHVKAKLYLDAAKMVVPRPQNEEEANASSIQSEFMKRLFGDKSEED